MSNTNHAGTFKLGNHEVSRIGFGAMQLAGHHAFGPPRDRAAAMEVVRAAIDAGVNHVDTADFYGPHTTNQLLREALSSYRDGVVLAAKVGVRRDEKGAWLSAATADELEQQVMANLESLGLDALEIVNFRSMLDPMKPKEGSIEEPLEKMADLQRRGLVRRIGLSNVTAAQVAEGRSLCDVACVQNHYNVAHRVDDELIDTLAADGIAYVPFFPLGGISPLQSSKLSEVAEKLSATPMQVALAWLLQRSPNILLIPGTSSVQHLRENLAAGTLTIDPDSLRTLESIAGMENG